MKAECIQSRRIKLPKLCTIQFIRHQPIPSELFIKNARVTRKTDSWHVGLLLECKEFPASTPSINLIKSVDIDIRLKDFLATSRSENIVVPQYFRQSERKPADLQYQFSTQVMGLNRWRK